MSLTEDGFIWQTAGGSELMRGKRGSDGVWEGWPLNVPATDSGWDRIEQDLARLRQAPAEFMAGAEVIGPDLYRDLVAPYTARGIEFLNDLGFKTGLLHGGSALPMLDILAELPCHAIMVEEGRNGYSNDIGEVRRIVGPDRPLYGNVDISLLETASDEDVLAEVRRQVDHAGRDAPFVVSTGSPLTRATTPERVRLFCESGAAYGQ